MKHPNTRIARLKEMIALEEQRASLQNNIAAVNQRLSTIQTELYGAAAKRAAAKEQRQALLKLQPKLARKGRGELKGQILEILQAAGRSGASVKELSGRIGLKTANIHSWFSANLKKISKLQKIGEARYALSASNGSVAKAAKKVKAPKAKKAKALKALEAPKSPKAAKPLKAKKARKTKAGRGELKGQILNELKQAGAEGITIKDLSEKLKANYKNIYIWFVTTGKRIPGIQKVGPAQYKLEAAA
jgi:predicted trehalose synthase